MVDFLRVTYAYIVKKDTQVGPQETTVKPNVPNKNENNTVIPNQLTDDKKPTTGDTRSAIPWHSYFPVYLWQDL